MLCRSANLDDGQFPLGTQAKIGWQGVDGSAIDAIALKPVAGPQVCPVFASDVALHHPGNALSAAT